MARQSSAARTSRAPALLSIGQVLARLTPDFPGLTPSKLRFLEEQGLVSPSRTASGYRKFSGADIDRLRLILTMQREHYLPLRVIREHLADLDAGRTPSLPDARQAVGSSILGGARRLSRDELLRETGASPALLSEAIAGSFLAPADGYGDQAVRVLRAFVELQRHGIEPRHLRSMRGAVEREVGLIESAVAPLSRRRHASSRDQAVEVGLVLATQLEVVRASLVRSALTRREK